MEQAQSGVQQVLSGLLEQQEPTTRPAIAAAFGLSRPTVFSAIQRLESLGLVQPAGQSSGRPGRSPVLYEIAPAAGLLAAVDIGGSNVRLALTDVRGRIMTELREPARRGGPQLVDQVEQLVHRGCRDLADARPLTLTAVSVPGVVGADGCTVHFASNIDQPTPFDLVSPLQHRLGTPVLLENNVNSAAIGERWRGVARTLTTFAVVAVGAGIGAGIMHEGRLLRGAHGAAGEVAFLPPAAGCGRADITAYDEAGGLSLLQTARARSGWQGSPPASVQEMFERAEHGEPVAAALVAEECERVAAVVAAVCAVVDPERVILTGGVGGNDHLIAEVGRLTRQLTLFSPPVVASALGERASLTGAIRLAATRAAADLVAAVTA